MAFIGVMTKRMPMMMAMTPSIDNCSRGVGCGSAIQIDPPFADKYPKDKHV